MITPQIKRQLIAFVLVTALTLATMFIFYMRGPASLGIGIYHVTVRMPASGGLYPDAQVTYRGVPIGLVESMSADASGATAILRLNSGTRVPVDLQAQVRSTSAIGEQYLDLIPRSGVDSGDLADGSVIAAANVSLPTTTTALLSSVEQLMKSVHSKDLNTTVSEVALAFGSGTDDLGHFLDAAGDFQKSASANLTPTMELLDHLQKFLAVESRSASNLTSGWASLNRITGRVSSSDDALRGLITTAPSVLNQVGSLSQSLQPVLPQTLASAETVANVLKVYRSYIEHALIVFPAAVAEFQSGVIPKSPGHPIPEARLGVKSNLNNPADCTKGYAEAGHMRDANDLSPKADAANNYCKVAHNDPRVVRGARNLPCPNSTARAATPALCGLTFPLFTAAGTSSPLLAVIFMDPASNEVVTSNGTITTERVSLAADRPTSLLSLLIPSIP